MKIIHIDASPDGQADAHIIEPEPSWVVVCLYAAAIALGIAAGIIIVMPLP